MNLRTEKEDLINGLNRANKLAEEATLNYMNMCKQVEILEKCLDEIYKIINKNCQDYEDCDDCYENGYEACYWCIRGEIERKIKEVKGDE